ncbi:MAG: hypothetical protein WCG25_00555 [bacterium]
MLHDMILFKLILRELICCISQDVGLYQKVIQNNKLKAPSNIVTINSAFLLTV